MTAPRYNMKLRFTKDPDSGEKLPEVSMEPSPTGNWVAYKDHLQEVVDAAQTGVVPEHD